MSATNLYMNWTGVTCTPAGGSAIALGQITDIEVDGKSVQKAFYGDARAFPLLLRNTAKTRTIKIVGGNPKLMLTIPEDVACTIVAIFNDAVNGVTAAGGAFSVTATGAKRESMPFGGKNNEFGIVTGTFHCQSDATTDADPVVIAAL